jgi:hypothetical protein
MLGKILHQLLICTASLGHLWPQVRLRHRITQERPLRFSLTFSQDMTRLSPLCHALKSMSAPSHLEILDIFEILDCVAFLKRLRTTLALPIFSRSSTQTYPHSAHTTQFSIQPALVLFRHSRSIGICQVYRPAERRNTTQETEPHYASPGWSHVVVLIQRENTQNIVILVHWLAPVASVLLVVPVAVGISLLAVDARRVDVASVLYF